MPEYLSPGVYIEEVEAGPKPIAGVSTSTAGMVGVTVRGPTDGKPELVTSFAEFIRKFGGFLPVPDGNIVNRWALDPAEGARWWWFPLSVKGFFDNGGQRVYVKRVFSGTAVAGNATLGRGLVSHVVADAASGVQRLRLEHLFGIDDGTAVTVFKGDDGTQIGPNFTVQSYDPTTNAVDLDAALPEPVLANRGDFVQIAARSASPVPAAEETLRFEARSLGEWGNALAVRTRPVAESTINILPDANLGGASFSASVAAVAAVAGPPPVWTITVDDVTGLAVGDHVLVLGQEYELATVNAAPANTFTINPAPAAAAPAWPAGTVVKRLRLANAVAPAATSNQIGLFGADQLYEGALLELDNGTAKERITVVSVSGDIVTLSGQLTEQYYENQRVRVIGIQVDVTYAPGGTVEAEETFGPLRLVNDGSTSFLVTHVNLRSALVRVATRNGFSDDDIAFFPTSTSGGVAAFSGGDDDLDGLTPDDFVGQDQGSGRRTGVAALEDIDEVSVCAAPNVWSSTVRSALITHCEILKDRFAIIDSQDGLSIEGIRAAREPLDSKYAALYYPWVVVRDPRSRRNVGVGPSGHMAGIYARTDEERGVHKAPANVVIRGIDRIAQDVTKREQDMLNPKNINVLRAFPNLGSRVWGARTLSSDAQWRYVNVRRLFIFVEESIEEGTQWVVFEPNDEPLWARVRQSISNFLLTVWRNGALEGVTPEEAFFVTCDRTTMTQDDIDNGRLICLIGIAPVKPAEFVIFRIQQKTRESQPA